jgi:hypothetical protein
METTHAITDKVIIFFIFAAKVLISQQRTKEIVLFLYYLSENTTAKVSDASVRRVKNLENERFYTLKPL